jgi:hypothetical protein
VKTAFLFTFLSFSLFAHAQHNHDAPPQPQDRSTTEHQHDQAPPQPKTHDHSAMQQMDHSQHAGLDHVPETLVDQTLLRATAGTAAAPLSTPFHMLMKEKWGWRWMLHGNIFVNALQQSGPRGGDKVFASNWFMPMAQRDLGPGQLTFKVMFSLEPATVTHRRYPLLLQMGEVAFGRPIIDGQHPHDMWGEIAGVYDWKIREGTLLSFYGGIIGDPALGPESFPHRLSASEDPLAPLGHHLQDSSHIASDVVTFGVTHKMLRVEASGFHGREPNENRWNIDQGAMDSWSTRIAFNPGKNWSMQFSTAKLASAEESHPDEDIRRTTASISYNRPIANGNWSNLLLWGRNNVNDEFTLSSYLAESTLRFLDKNYVWTRIENVDRTNELLLDGNAPPPGFHEEPFARVQAYTAGYSRDIARFGAWSMGIGGQVNWYGIPDKLRPLYGDHPHGGVVFIRLRPHN